MKVVDAHLHLWRLGTGDYAWNTSALGPAHDDFWEDEAETMLKTSGTDVAILVQAADTVADSERLLEVARRSERFVGVVAWVPLDDPGRAAALLDQWVARDHVVGTRSLVHDAPRADVLQTPDAVWTARQIARTGLAIDIPDAWPDLWPSLVTLVDAVPEATFVLDHLGKPGPRSAGDGEWFRVWRAELDELANRPNVVAKLSGLGRARRDLRTIGVDPHAIVDAALGAFGVDRCMVGSDWPLSLIDDSRENSDLTTNARGLSDTEARALLAGTASRVYGLADQPRAAGAS